ncbi:DUF72 domain-containing protein [Herbaspirillum sp. YR522]|uniref:DUF72 domain-containing protein n=1 Tax=Herbaspirillum sp. YR522 TaxID=1144342 RepID=UPI00026F7735|nr:DUF72 domain-containing protein [Herbaspirillum sp. YR522]EJM96382.1 hypothetical protein PMI40_04614 [Herbaspirillum sp. YR522]
METDPPRDTVIDPFPIRIGCAGWSLSSQVADRFATEGSHLQRYAQVFSMVEINSSFYRPHQAKTYARWADSVPEAFRFAVKLPRQVSHELRLRDADAALGQFMQQVTALGEKLGCLLLQLPPSLALDPDTAVAFFALLARHTAVPVACEPRHASWFSPLGAEVLEQAGVACVRAHPRPVAEGEPQGDWRRLYIRLHGAPQIYYSAYDAAFIAAVGARIVEAREAGRQVWCVFDNTARGAALPNALALMALLNGTGKPA